jgi:hypothetical protein
LVDIVASPEVHSDDSHYTSIFGKSALGMISGLSVWLGREEKNEPGTFYWQKPGSFARRAIMCLWRWFSLLGEVGEVRDQ